MADNYYGDDEAPSADQTPKADEGDEKDTSTKTAVIDSNICPGMEPGDEMVVKIEKVLENQYLVSYAPEPEKEEEPETPPETEPAAAGAPAGGGYGEMMGE